MLIQIIIGDDSGDGHCVTNTTLINSSLNPSEIRTAYEKGSEIIGRNFIKEVKTGKVGTDCLDEDWINVLIRHEIYEADASVKNDSYVDKDLFFYIYMKIVLLGNPSFIYSVANKPPELAIGGYGFY